MEQNTSRTPLQTYILDLFAEQHNIAQKKIFLFGGEYALESILDELSEVCKIEKMLNNKASSCGRKINGIDTVSPEVLRNEISGEFIVLILSRYVESMKKQLCDMGLAEGIDYFDLFTPIHQYLQTERFRASIQRFEQFLDRIPECYFEQIPITRQEHIGVVVLCEMTRYLTVFSLTQALLLRSEGYKVTLIIDTLKAFEGYRYFEGIETIIQNLLKPVLPKIRAKCSDIEILYIDREGRATLTKEDESYIKGVAKAVLRWFKYCQDIGTLKNHVDDIKWAEDILTHAFSHTKSFFQNYKYDAISVYTGIHRHRAMFLYAAEQQGIRVATWDFGGEDKLHWNSDGVATHSEDIAKLIRENRLTQGEKKKCVELAQEHFQRRRDSTVQDGGSNYQLVRYDRKKLLEKAYDIVIPLNIAWDAAALGRDDLFKDYLDWLDQTLRYILDHTDSNVIVREHPAQNLLKNYIYDDLRKELPIIEENSDRIYFAAADAAVNTYRYIESCKLVLPYTSTTGVESAIMGKNVILHANVYYENIGIAYKAKSVEDYFRAISYYLGHPEEKICNSIENAYLAFLAQMNTLLPCKYNLRYLDWLDCTMDELRQLPGVSTILACIGDGIPTIYSKIKAQLSNCGVADVKTNGQLQWRHEAEE